MESAPGSHLFRKGRNAEHFALCGNDKRQPPGYKYLAALRR
jgi:hypothetical protein